ncbi:MAG: two component signal transduction system response regulator [Algoriphagus marincola HL-49]|uniref:Two component signal transduction system response regulator n=1 Tax=Algoriphagus marincola HL-49 TaxID=1305737 RepID=A0A0P7XET0_9BACT|nr:MAG: two component signal transduction system response regulator [Algoriphagus marincola HL-49]
MNSRPIKILLVEDNEGDIVLTMEALKDSQLPNEIIIKKDGEAAITYLKELEKSQPKQLPDLILLDINLPKMNGHEVLNQIKNDPELKRTPIIVLTTSSSETDIIEAYSKHANCYITKPVDINDFLKITSKIEEFWFNVVKLPTSI